VLLENPRPTEADRILSPDTARLMTAMLTEVTAKGTAARYMAESRQQGLDTAGKTGTTQNNCDRWFIGYTPRLLCGVWMGYDYPRELRGIEGNPCAGIWDHLMSRMDGLYECNGDKTAFDFRDHLIQKDFCRLSGLCDSGWCAHPEHGGNRAKGWFIPGTEPRELCAIHGEPPIRVPPADPADPDRIPLFPHDLLDGEPPQAHEKQEENRGFGWDRWFGRRGRSGSSGEEGGMGKSPPKDPLWPDTTDPAEPSREEKQGGWLSQFFGRNSRGGYDR
jgi:membrane peptidoglycan carboxypeptidase